MSHTSTSFTITGSPSLNGGLGEKDSIGWYVAEGEEATLTLTANSLDLSTLTEFEYYAKSGAGKLTLTIVEEADFQLLEGVLEATGTFTLRAGTGEEPSAGILEVLNDGSTLVISGTFTAVAGISLMDESTLSI